MYTLSEENLESVEIFIGKLEDSLIKSRCEKWLGEVAPTHRATTEQMEQFVGFATHLPQSVQHFPQAFAMAVKNAPETEIREDKEGTQETADLNDLLNESIENVKDIDSPEDEEETLHKLGVKKGVKSTRGNKKNSK